MGKTGELTLPMVRLILTEEKPKERKVTIKSEKISRFFSEEYSSEIENGIIQLLGRNGRRNSKGGAVKWVNRYKFDYYYGIEAEQFSLYRVPRLLIKDEAFQGA